MHKQQASLDQTVTPIGADVEDAYPGTWDGQGHTTQWQPCCARWSAAQTSKRMQGKHELVTG